MLIRSLTSLLLLLLPLSVALSGSTGKITGTVKDKKTGDILAGANVRLEGTALGAATDLDGKYFIINVSPNDYTLLVTMVGYTASKTTGVRVRGDLTTTIDVELSETVLQVGQEVVVTAERPLVQKDLTASTAIVSGKDISALPVTEVNAVVALQAGFTSSGNLRGGRSGEVAYWIDGVPITDAYDGGQVVEVNKSLVQELQVISGAFNAEYGQAMSGIVNITSKEGSSRFTGGLGTYVGDYLPANDGVFLGNKFKVNNIRNIEGNVSGPILSDKLSFFANARYIYFNGYEKGYRYYNPWNYSILPSGGNALVSVVPNGIGDSSVVPMDWSERYYAQGKLTWHISSLMKLNVDYIYDDRKNKKYDRAYFYNPDGKGNEYNLSNTMIFQFNHSLSSSTFYTISGSYFLKDYKYYLYDLKYQDSTLANGDHIQNEVVDPYGSHYVYPELSVTPSYSFMTGGTDPNKSHRSTATGLIKFDLTSQIDEMNMVKFGVEYRSHLIKNESITLTQASSQTGFDYINVPQSIAYMRTEIPDITAPGHDYYEHRPQEFSGYLQDKMEFKNIIINIGVRFDYFDPDGYVLNDSHPDANDPLHYMYTVDDPSIDNPIREEHRLKSNGDTVSLAERETYWYKRASAKYAVSPRIGVSFPITDRGIVHFSYGHFFQIPRFERLYENPRFKLSQATSDNMGTVGNADLKPEQTVSAELGVQQQLSEDVSFDLTAYMRDIRGLTGTQGDNIPVFGGGEYYRYSNSDFGIVKGIVLTIDKRFSSGVTARVDYTYQVAKGTASDPQQAQNARAGGALPDVEMVSLDWDQRHTLNVSLNYSASVWGISSIIQYGSGSPYTPALQYSGEVSTMVTNSQTKPSTFNCDLRAYYEITFRPAKLVLFARVFNVFDTRNQTNVYTSTGRSDYSLDAINAAKTQMLVNTVDQWFNDPSRYSEPRRIEIGMNLEF
jgi:outer membrane cobalamin receptor